MSGLFGNAPSSIKVLPEASRPEIVNVPSPICAWDRLTGNGVVKEMRPEGKAARVVVGVWCQNEHGETTVVGTASG